MIGLLRELADDLELKKYYPDWILVALAASASAILIIDPFNIFTY